MAFEETPTGESQHGVLEGATQWSPSADPSCLDRFLSVLLCRPWRVMTEEGCLCRAPAWQLCADASSLAGREMAHRTALIP